MQTSGSLADADLGGLKSLQGTACFNEQDPELPAQRNGWKGRVRITAMVQEL